ncbi:hypothetical protein [Burkholderia sp. Ac-20379]|uniref:hypothetical protein n=1 Tax=Burkholderia sp. Ac-20379 TaxID=2703900 RepID=UPI001981C204|nr:hypothetical protein [Burkholderia sp. Ac-20379]MBN3725561.1 hypothetical protein [Burkholderia sp. Ac-20379]
MQYDSNDFKHTHAPDDGTAETAPTAVELDLSLLELLVARLVPGEPAPIALWRGRLEAMLGRDGLQPAERAQLDDIVARLRELEARNTRLALH